MKFTLKDTSENENFRRYIFFNTSIRDKERSFFAKFAGESPLQEVIINSPYFCPICGNKEIAGKSNLEASNTTLSKYGIIYIEIPVCKEHNKSKLFNKFLIFEIFKEKSVISVRRSYWAEEFKRLNECVEFTGDLSLFNAIKRKFKRINYILGFLTFFSVLPIFLSFLMNNIIIRYLSYVIGIFFVILFFSFNTYSILKLRRIKSDIYFEGALI